MHTVTFKAQKALKATTNGTVSLPLKSNGALDHVEQFDLTPVIGREFPHANLVEWLQSPNADELITELALTSM